MTEIKLLVTPVESGKYVAFDSEGAGKIVFTSDATQLASAMSLMRFPKGTLLELTVREADVPFSDGAE